MRLFATVAPAILGLAVVRAVAGAPSNHTSPGCCQNPLIRYEWRQLSLEQRSSYIDAIKCLMSLPSEGNDLWPGAKTRYDDFQGMHIYVTEQVHFNVSKPNLRPKVSR